MGTPANTCGICLMGIEPMPSAWKADILPLYYKHIMLAPGLWPGTSWPPPSQAVGSQATGPVPWVALVCPLWCGLWSHDLGDPTPAWSPPFALGGLEPPIASAKVRCCTIQLQCIQCIACPSAKQCIAWPKAFGHLGFAHLGFAHNLGVLLDTQVNSGFAESKA